MTKKYICVLGEEINAIEKVLNVLEKYKKENIDASKIIRKQNLMINAMALQLSGISIWDDQKKEPIILISEEAVKKYYERKVKNEV